MLIKKGYDKKHKIKGDLICWIYIMNKYYKYLCTP